MRTGAAFALAVIGACIVAVGRVFGLLEMYVVGTGLFTTACAAVVTTLSRIVLVDVHRSPSIRQPHVGDEFGVDLTLTAIRRSPRFEFSDIISDSSGSITGLVEFTVPPLRRGERSAGRYRMRADRRGVISLGPARIRSGDPLGLTLRTTSAGLADEIVVSPRWSSIALPEIDDCDGELISAIRDLATNSSADREFRSLREYASGDDARLVNWRATARRDSLIVNEYESRSGILLDVFLDDVAATYSPEGFERAVSVAASFVNSAHLTDDQQVQVRLSFGSKLDASAFDAVIDDSTRHDAMRSLALVNCSERESRPTMSSNRTSVSIPVIVCGARDGEWILRVQRILRGSPIGVVIHTESATPELPSTRWFAVPVEDFDFFTPRWARLCRRINVS